KYPTQSAIGSTRGKIGERSADRTARDREKEQSHTLVHRRRLLRLHHAASHSAKHPRKSRLVHCLHAVPVRTRSGSSRSAAQFTITLNLSGKRTRLARWLWWRRISLR